MTRKKSKIESKHDFEYTIQNQLHTLSQEVIDIKQNMIDRNNKNRRILFVFGWISLLVFFAYILYLASLTDYWSLFEDFFMITGVAFLIFVYVITGFYTYFVFLGDKLD